MTLKTDIILKAGDLVATGTCRQGREEFMLRRDVMFEAKAPGSGVGVIVPAGYVTDRYSLPGLFEGFQPDAERWLLPALIHDWLYDVGQYPRGQCDAIFSEAMGAAGVKWWHRLGAFLGVRVGGGRGYGKPVQANEALVRRAREQGFHTWGEDRAERYGQLEERLSILKAMYEGKPLRLVVPAPVIENHPAGAIPAAAVPEEAPGFDPDAFFHGESGIRNALWKHGISKRAVHGCERIIACFERFAPAGTREQLAYILATAYHETGARMQPVREAFGTSDQQSISRLETAWQAGQLKWVRHPYWRDGFFGRGLVQLTHRRNYAGPLRDAVLAEFGPGVDILAEPSLLIDDFDVSAYVLIEGMMRGDTGLGDFTSDALEDHVHAEGVDYETARRVVNPGDAPTYATIAAQARAFEAALEGARWSQSRLADRAAA